MKAVILAGGLGSRISEESHLRPKPMIEIGDRPILWHLMKYYSHFGVNEFVICVGYKGYVIKEYFANYVIHSSDVTFDLANDDVVIHNRMNEPWRVTLVETGENTQTAGRLRRVRSFLSADEPFFMTYGDGLADVDLAALLAFHKDQGRDATVTVVQPPGRFGVTVIEGERVTWFSEKPEGEGGVINGGFFVLELAALDGIEGDASVWEEEPLQNLAVSNQLSAFRHEGYWQPMDTLRDKKRLEQRWLEGNAPWKVWS